MVKDFSRSPITTLRHGGSLRCHVGSSSCVARGDALRDICWFCVSVLLSSGQWEKATSQMRWFSPLSRLVRVRMWCSSKWSKRQHQESLREPVRHAHTFYSGLFTRSNSASAVCTVDKVCAQMRLPLPGTKNPYIVLLRRVCILLYPHTSACVFFSCAECFKLIGALNRVLRARQLVSIKMSPIGRGVTACRVSSFFFFSRQWRNVQVVQRFISQLLSLSRLLHRFPWLTDHVRPERVLDFRSPQLVVIVLGSDDWPSQCVCACCTHSKVNPCPWPVCLSSCFLCFF